MSEDQPSRQRWRRGRHNRPHIYLQLGPEPADDDPWIGHMDTPELADEAVEDHNTRMEEQP